MRQPTEHVSGAWAMKLTHLHLETFVGNILSVFPNPTKSAIFTVIVI